MAVYFILFTLCALFCLIGYNNNKFDKAGSLLITLFMCTLCSLRALNCGTDTINYYRIFFFNPEISDLRLEPLFLLIRNSFSDFQFFLAFFAIITYGIVYRICSKEVRYTSLAIFIFMISPTKFFPESFNIIRQSTAAAFILWGFVEWNNQKKWQTIILFIIATTLHYSSILAFLFLFLPRGVIGSKLAMMVVLATFLLGISGITTIAVQKFVVSLGNAEIHPLITTYARYGFRVNNTMHFSSLLLWLTPLSLFAISCYPKREVAKQNYQYYYNVFLVGVILGNLFIPPMDSGIRFVFSIMITQIIVVPSALKYASNRQKGYIVGCIAICAASYLFYIYHLQFFNETSIVPYRSII